METPILTFVKEYESQQKTRFHMPGHKGKCFLGCEPWDITEIKGADDLAHAEGIILQSEDNASSLFGSRHTFYSTGGSSQSIRAMLYLAFCLQGKSPASSHILAARNAHKSFLFACAMLDLNVTWMYPEKSSSLCSCPISPEQLEDTLSSLSPEEFPFAVYVTSPDYLGGMQDIKALAEVAHKYHIPLLVDNAHGAYLKFLTPSMHPLDLGADMCCDSAHKTLPALTGCSYLHISQAALQPYESQARMALSLFGSTSPSYLLLESLDLCNEYLADYYSEKLADAIYERGRMCDILTKMGFCIPDSDPLRLVIDAAEIGTTGDSLSEVLRASQIECEYADMDYVVLLFTPENTADDWNRLLTAAKSLRILPARKKQDAAPKAGAAGISIRQALFSAGITVPIEEAAGKISAAPVVSCPPAIPIVVSGEYFTEESLSLCKQYGIEEVFVVKSF